MIERENPPESVEPESESLASAGQVGGNHYKNLWCDPATYCEKNGLTPLEFSVIKYITRHRDKNGLEDLKKAMHFCQMLIKNSYGQNVDVTYPMLPTKKENQ